MAIPSQALHGDGHELDRHSPSLLSRALLQTGLLGWTSITRAQSEKKPAKQMCRKGDGGDCNCAHTRCLWSRCSEVAQHDVHCRASEEKSLLIWVNIARVASREAAVICSPTKHVGAWGHHPFKTGFMSLRYVALKPSHHKFFHYRAKLFKVMGIRVLL